MTWRDLRAKLESWCKHIHNATIRCFLICSFLTLVIFVVFILLLKRKPTAHIKINLNASISSMDSIGMWANSSFYIQMKNGKKKLHREAQVYQVLKVLNFGNTFSYPLSGWTAWSALLWGSRSLCREPMPNQTGQPASLCLPGLQEWTPLKLTGNAPLPCPHTDDTTHHTIKLRTYVLG